MAPTIPVGEPSLAQAGETWKWSASWPDYPASESWVLSYELAGTGKANRITLASSVTTVDGDGWDVVVPASTTKVYVADTYEFTAVFTGAGSYAGEIYHEPLPLLTIQPNLVTASPTDRVKYCREMVDLLNAIIKARLQGDEPQFYMVDGTNVQRMATDQLMRMRASFAQEIATLTKPGEFGRRVQYRMKAVSS